MNIKFISMIIEVIAIIPTSVFVLQYSNINITKYTRTAKLLRFVSWMVWMTNTANLAVHITGLHLVSQYRSLWLSIFALAVSLAFLFFKPQK